MPTPRLRIHSIAFVLGALALLGACGGDDDTGAADGSTSTEATSTTEPDDDEGSGGGTDDPAVDDAVASLQAQGFSEDGARCVIESAVGSGVAPEDLARVEGPNPPQAVIDAFTDAGAACASKIAGDIPENLVDLEDPSVRQAFVRSFSQSSGLSTEVADCAAQWFIDNDVDYDDLIALAGGQEDPDVIAQVQAAVESCT